MRTRRITLDEFHKQIDAQNAPNRESVKLVCPMCGVSQSANDLIKAGAGATFDDVEKYLGFSCVDRWLGAGGPRETPDGLPCNWTLGGLFTLHKLEVIMPDGKVCLTFEVALADLGDAA